ncbi:MAG TPA: cob(I)yrinic acid a,c-diamide adenosyltransferase [Verrucomicrobiales bacterium]|jgi:cob(I)alamin adenosyltransferase|nr:cob(I)yrinic acid a,c-diamide adenosyltransferase [Verrucomicrobiota bacterium]HCP06532.1 cob(I)yrinic acid a,c-diamide adenosyltransferase [Verrucomicrobiales bacterium]
MSITTRTGDGGSTALMYGRRVPKDSPRVEAYGEVDELNACLGLARAQTQIPLKSLLESIQKALVGLMGELAVASEDLKRYEADGYARIKEEDLALLDQEIERLERNAPPAKGWSTPGGSLAGAALDLARAVCRRAERGVWCLDKKEGNVRPIIPKYLNRLSDLLWLVENEVDSSGSVKNKT